MSYIIRRARLMKVREVEILPDGRMDGDNTALYIDSSPKTLAMLRSQGKGPAFVKLGKIYYFKEDVDRWIAEAAGCKSTAQARLKNKGINKSSK
jgi:hypothetical protein